MFCCYCGNDMGGEIKYPQKCGNCESIHYKNPIPVAVGLVPCIENNRVGVLLIRRSKGRTAGKWALPGGFIDIADANWQHGIARECKEETGFDLIPELFESFDLGTAGDGNLLVFVKYNYGKRLAYNGEQPPINGETDGMRVTTEPIELAFPLHTAALKRYFEFLRILGVNTVSGTA